jgi:hypothetical protein
VIFSFTICAFHVFEFILGDKRIAAGVATMLACGATIPTINVLAVITSCILAAIFTKTLTAPHASDHDRYVWRAFEASARATFRTLKGKATMLTSLKRAYFTWWQPPAIVPEKIATIFAISSGFGAVHANTFSTAFTKVAWFARFTG